MTRATIHSIVFMIAFASASPVLATGASACEEIDLRTDRCEDGRSRLPAVRDQGLTNYCWAYSLADYYSFTTCQDYSGLHVGLSVNMSYRDSHPAVQKLAAGDTGAKLPSGPHLVLNSGMQVQEGHRVVRSLHGACLESDFSSNRQEIREGAAFDRFLSNYYDRRMDRDPISCQKRSIPEVDFTIEANDREFGRSLHASLSRRSPVFLHFNPEIVTNRNAKRGAGHVALVVGRKMHRGRCQLLVRDPTPVTTTAWPRTQDGYVWIEEGALMGATADITTAQSYTASSSTLASGARGVSRSSSTHSSN